MTIRQFVTRRLLWGFGVFALAMAALIVTSVAGGNANSAAVVICIVAIVAAAGFINLGIRCTKCGGNLGITVVPALFPFWSKHRVKFCAYCGVSLDEER